jgi:hypothetical protein
MSLDAGEDAGRHVAGQYARVLTISSPGEKLSNFTIRLSVWLLPMPLITLRQ